MNSSNENGDVRVIAGVGAMIVSAIERYSNRVAFTCRGREFTYRQFGDHVSQALQFFEEAGLKRGDAIMQLTANSYEMFVLMASAYIGGYISVTPHYGGSEEDHLFVFQDCEAALLVGDAVRASRCVNIKQNAGHPVQVYCHETGSDAPDIWQKIEAYPPQRLVARDKPDDVIRLIYTGGTTGKPKGVITLSSQLAFASLMHLSEQNYSPSTRFLAAPPISHGAGSLIIPVLFKGGCIVLHQGFNIDKVLDGINGGEINSAFLVPTMLSALMDSPRISSIDMSGLNRIIYAASPISLRRLTQALEIFGPVLQQNYGQTEVPGTVLTLRPDEHLDLDANRLSSAGKPYACVDVKLLDDHGVEVAMGEVGEICVRAPHATPGYWKRPDLTEELWRWGWLHTGDMARKDDDGYFHIVDRKKDMIISGGFNVYPKELETVLLAHPDVDAAAVIGVPHEKWGEAVKAVIVRKRDSAITDEELIEYVKDRKGSVMAPKTVDFVDELPLTNLGKIDKKALRAPYWSSQARNVN